MDKLSKIEDIIFQAIEADKEIKVRWNCGDDQATISVFLDGERLKHENPFVREIDVYLMNYLDLPSVGPFELEGEGKFVIENDELYIVYESYLKGTEDYDNPGGGWIELNEKDESYSGKKKFIKDEDVF